jgi:UDP-N-acetylmuramoyl-L-alanine---L-glutamate ligase
VRISDILHRRVGLLGLGREGLATARALRRAGHTVEIAAFVDAPTPAPDGVLVHTSPEHLATMDVVVRSPGFAPAHPLRIALDACGVLQTTATQIFLREMRDAGLTVIGITASKGKSTTSKLTQLVLREAGADAELVGNIGTPALDVLDQMVARRAMAVMELSSYQCADLLSGYGPQIAVIGALFPEHLDYHGGASQYYRAKARIALTQRTGDTCFCHIRSLWLLEGLQVLGATRVLHSSDGLHYADGYFWRGSERLFSGSDMRVLGDHNRENAVVALTLGELFGATVDHLQRVVSTFPGLPYRLQDEGVYAGIRWINDSISTAPDATAAALRALGAAARTLIVGGYDRGSDIAPVVEAVSNSALKDVVLLPATGAAIAARLRANAPSVRLHEAPNLAEAVRVAKQVTAPGATCVFSPGAPSYTFFRDFEARGEEFRKNVLETASES